jgi:hypothetical protein
MAKLLPMEIKALSLLLKSSKGLDAFTFFLRLDASFSDFSKFTRALCEKNLINEENDDFFVISQEGITQLTKKNAYKKTRPWREVPKKYLIPTTKVSDFYIPSLCLLDKKAFNNS